MLDLRPIQKLTVEYVKVRASDRGDIVSLGSHTVLHGCIDTMRMNTQAVAWTDDGVGCTAEVDTQVRSSLDLQADSFVMDSVQK